MSSRITDELGTPDAAFESTLRPEGFDQFSGQDKVRERLEIAVTSAQQRKEPIDHLLLSGPPGLGKTTLANIIAKAMGGNLRATSGPTIEKAADLAGLLTNLEEGDVLFIAAARPYLQKQDRVVCRVGERRFRAGARLSVAAGLCRRALLQRE